MEPGIQFSRTQLYAAWCADDYNMHSKRPYLFVYGSLIDAAFSSDYE
jgi:hypothetical protein